MLTSILDYSKGCIITPICLYIKSIIINLKVLFFPYIVVVGVSFILGWSVRMYILLLCDAIFITLHTFDSEFKVNGTEYLWFYLRFYEFDIILSPSLTK